MKPQRIQFRRSKGWRMPPNCVKVDRTTKWGNPFVAGKHGDREKCVALFRVLAAGFIVVTDEPTMDAQMAYRESLAEAIGELRGKSLGCWCAVGDLCHGDVLLELANNPQPKD